MHLARLLQLCCREEAQRNQCLGPEFHLGYHRSDADCSILMLITQEWGKYVSFKANTLILERLWRAEYSYQPIRQGWFECLNYITKGFVSKVPRRVVSTD
jgi:hypothetical protein